MNLQALFILSVTVLGGAAFAAPSHSASLAAPDGLVAAQSGHFHEFYVRPDADLAGYRRIMIDPVQVEFRKDWQSDMNYPRNVTRSISEDETRRIAGETASGLEGIVAEVFRVRGYEIAAAREPGVLRLSLTVTDLYVNAPDARTTVLTRTFIREAGGATLHLEARDAASGTVLARGVVHGTTQVNRPLTLANSVSNRFWFEGLFTRWATGCADEFEAGRNRP